MSVFEKLKKDFGGSIGNLCKIDLSNENDFQNITSKVYSFMVNLEKKLIESANQPDNKEEIGDNEPQFTKENLKNICEPLTLEEYQLTFYDKDLVSLEEIMLHKNSYILTTLMFDGSGERLKGDSKQLYDNLCDLLNNKLLSNLLDVLNNPKKSRNALISWNTLAHTYKMVIKTKVCRNMIDKTGKYIELQNNIYKQVSEAITNNNDNLNTQKLGTMSSNVSQVLGEGESVAVEMSGGARRRSPSRSSSGSRRSSSRSSSGSRSGSSAGSRRSSSRSSSGSRSGSSAGSRSASSGSRSSSVDSRKSSASNGYSVNKFSGF